MDFLYLLVEGEYDLKFFNSIYSDLVNLTGIYNIHIIRYQSKLKKKKLVNGIINSSKRNNSHYFLIGDLDSHSFPCITHRKEDLKNYYVDADLNKIIIVKEEIESWYFSGLTTKLSFFNSENLSYDCSKEEFESSIVDNNSKMDCITEIMENFDINLAIKNNESFKYFINKLKSLKTN
ncbi:MAG: hypothetical protein LBM96_00420 [Methanobrevibacter sp.]|nr:hypothetical protein [Candidatus Methanoflexus mossambicus]